MKLIISEKAIAGKTIASILAGKNIPASPLGQAQVFRFFWNGAECMVVPLRGHIVDVDFPKAYNNWVGTDLGKLTDAEVEYVGVETSIISALKESGRGASEVIIATDADREGESIGLEALNYIKSSNPGIRVKRAYFSAITKKDLDDAFSNLRELDYNFADSADSRREIDLIWGAVLTRFLSIASGRLGKEYLSVGRVQTPVLALIVGREKERLAFLSKKYWEYLAVLEKDSKQFQAGHREGKFWSKEVPESFFKEKPKTGTVMALKKSRKILKRPTPFNTTDFLRQATAIGFSAGQAMENAEYLYQQGYTSYPRTDNTVYPKTLNLREILQELSKISEFKNDAQYFLAQKELVPSQGKKETTDHPPVHPVSAAPRDKLSDRQWKIYTLIVRRFFATLAEDAVTENLGVDIDIAGQVFVANGQTILDPGWKKFYPYSELNEVILPAMKEGDIVNVVSLDLQEKQTQPPARYSQSSLIKLMEDLGLGTKCLSADTTVKIFNSPVPREMAIESVFDNSVHTGLFDESAEIRKNADLECIGVSKNGTVKRSIFALSSKRQLLSAEKICSLNFLDGSSVKATADHPVLCFKKNRLLFIPLSELSSGDNCVALHDNSSHFSGKYVDWATFLDKCDKRTYLFAYGLARELKTARSKIGLSQSAFAKILGCSQSNYCFYELGKKPVPLWVVKKFDLKVTNISSLNQKEILSNPFPIRIDSSLARILAGLIGDGSLDREKVKKENCFDFRYTNTNPDLIEQFRQDIESVFKISPKIYSSEDRASLQVKIPGSVGRMLSILFPEILNKLPWAKLPAEFYPDFIGQFFDDEGHAVKSESKIFLSNTNHATLKYLQEMLKSLNIESSLDAKQHKLYVRRRQSLFNFLEKIPVTSCYKKQRLVDIISSFYKYTSSKPYFVLERDILKALAAPKTNLELQRLLGISKSPINNRIQKLLSERKIRKIVEGNNKDVPRKISYCSLVDLANTAYPLLEEKVISSKLVTKKLESVELSEGSKFVYDITNSREFPAFVLGNNLIVHNSTRHTIIQKLYARNYISGSKSIEPSKVAFAVIDSLEKHKVDAVAPQMTAEIENEMELIAQGKKKKKDVVDGSRKILHKVLDKMMENREKIGQDIRMGFVQDAVLMKCPKCGQNLRVIWSKNKKRFVGCSGYPKCMNTYPLPQKGKIEATQKTCPVCQAPVIALILRRKFEMCLNMDCATKDEWKKKAAEKAQKVSQQPSAQPTPVKKARPQKRASKPKAPKSLE